MGCLVEEERGCWRPPFSGLYDGGGIEVASSALSPALLAAGAGRARRALPSASALRAERRTCLADDRALARGRSDGQLRAETSLRALNSPCVLRLDARPLDLDDLIDCTHIISHLLQDDVPFPQEAFAVIEGVIELFLVASKAGLSLLHRGRGRRGRS